MRPGAKSGGKETQLECLINVAESRHDSQKANLARGIEVGLFHRLLQLTQQPVETVLSYFFLVPVGPRRSSRDIAGGTFCGKA